MQFAAGKRALAQGVAQKIALARNNLRANYLTNGRF
jgi:hypothetical protein